MAFGRELVVKDGVEIVADFIFEPLIDPLNENPPANFSRKSAWRECPAFLQKSAVRET